MVGGNTKARAAARKAIESTYDGVCSISYFEDTTDPITHITSQQKVMVEENQPCRLSFESIKAVDQTETVGDTQQGTKLFLAPEIEVKPGADIEVEQDGAVTVYQRSGKPAVYHSHQEIMLELKEVRA